MHYNTKKVVQSTFKYQVNMKNKNFAKLAVLGITSGLMVSSHSASSASEPSTSAPSTSKQEMPRQGCGGQNGCGGDDDNGNIGYYVFSEDDLLIELNEKGEALYNSLSEEGKELARKVASQRCNGTNECAGLNACQTESNACAGKGSCKGQTKCAISDKNLAVKIAAAKMAKIKEENLKKEQSK